MVGGDTNNTTTSQHQVGYRNENRNGARMKTETKNKYFERLSSVRRQCQEWMALPEWEERASTLWERVRSVENGLIDGTNLNTLAVSNSIQALEVAVINLQKLVDGELAIVVEEGLATIDVTHKPVSQLGELVMESLSNIQGEYNNLYAAIVEKHPLIAELPVVLELKMRAAETGATMQKFGRLMGNL